MSDRTTRVTLIAQVNGYLQGMEKARQATSKMSDDSQAKLAQQREAMDAVGRSMLGIGAIATASFLLAVKAFADYDEKISGVKAATGESAENMKLLSDAAIQAGRDTAYGAGEAADAITELAKAGVSTADILGGALTGALDLAAAGEIGVARAAEIAATAMTQFKIAGSDVPRIADLLASGANNAQGGVEDLSQALGQAGLVSAAAGLSIEETVAGLSAFASAGLLGSDAGTSFKAMLQRLTPQSAEAKREMDRLGISAFDAKGEFIGLEGFAGNLREALKDLTPEQRQASQTIIFGSDAVRASNVLYEQGADGIRNWTALVDDSGAAARVAAERLDNLNGDLRILKGSFETALIQSGSGANEILRDMTQAATFLVNAFGDLPEPVLDATLAVVGTAGAIGLVGGATLLATPKVAAFRAQLQLAGISGRMATAGIIGVGGAVAAATFAISVFISKQAEMASQADALKDSFDAQTGALTGYTRELIAANLNNTDAFEQAEKLGVSQSDLVDVLYEGRDAWRYLREAAIDNGTATNLTRLEHERLRQVMDEQAVVLTEARKKWENAKKATEDNADVLAEVTDTAQAADEAVGDLTDTLSNFGRVQLDSRAAARDFEAAVDDATAALKENGATLNIATEEGRENQSALDDIAASANAHAAAVYEETGAMEDVTAALAAGREKYIEVGVSMGLSRDQAIKYADALIATPDAVRTEVELVGVESARARLASLASLYRAGSGVSLRAVVQADSVGRENGGIEEYADGGMREGIYRGRPGGILKFAEENVPWEAFISGKPGQEARNRRIWADAGNRLGVSTPVMVPASPSSSRSSVVNVTVPVSAGAVGSEHYLADTVTTAIRNAISSGALPRGWEDR